MVLTQLKKAIAASERIDAFPYHYGSYATNSDRKMGFFTSVRFHTTMVLTQLKKAIAASERIDAFPYHYGSYATESHWSKQYSGKSRFHTTMVLTQHLTLRKKKGQRLRFHTTMVLTQPTRVREVDLSFESKFPYHYGSYATGKYMRVLAKRLISFHTTMVLTQRVH